VKPGERHILFFGDSFVAGLGDPEARGWVGRVAAASAAAGSPFVPYVLGVRGETSAQIAARWRAEAGPRLHEEARWRVVFSFGANDAIVEDGSARPRVRQEVTVRTLERTLDEATSIGLAAFVVGPAPVGEAAPDARIVALTDRMVSSCEDREVPFVAAAEPLAACPAWRQEAMAGDGTHPGARGYEALARLVLDGGWLDWLRGW